MSSESDGWNVLTPAETNAQRLSKRSKIRYTRSFLLSLKNLSTKTGILGGTEPSVLSELGCLFDQPWEASYDSGSESCHEKLHKGLLSSENVGLLRLGSSLKVHSDIVNASQPMVEETILPLLHKKKEPYRPPRLSKHFDKTPNHYKSPATCCSESANQFPAIEKKPAYDISCNERSEWIAYGVSNDHSTKVLDSHLKTPKDETSQLSECKIPAVILLILGGLACVGLEHILKPQTKEYSCSMLWDGCYAEDGKQDSGNHLGSHHPVLLPEEGTELKDMTVSSELTIASDELHPSSSITDDKKLKFLRKGIAVECEKDLTREPSFGASSRKGMRLISACTCNQLRSVGRSTRKSVSQTGKFVFPIANKNHLPSATCEHKPSVINSEAILFSSPTDQSKGRENQSVSHDLKLNPVCCSDEKDSFPIELCLRDEDSLITVDDFRVLSYNDMPERNQVKADMVNPSAPVDSSRKRMDTKAGITDENSTHVKSVPPVYKGKKSYRVSQALINSQAKAINPKFKPQNPSNQAFSKNVLSIGSRLSQAIKAQQLHQILSKGMKRIPDDLRRYLATKGTTAVFLLKKYDMYGIVDSRETMYQDGEKLITNEKLRKYWIFWKRFFVIYTGEVLIGSQLLQYLRKHVSKKPMSKEKFVLLAYEFRPTEDGECDAWIGGLEPDGVPFLLLLFIGSKRDVLEMQQRLRPFKVTGCKLIVGAGAEAANKFLKTCKKINTREERKTAVVGTFAWACLRNEDTGGYTSFINLRLDGGQFLCNSIINRTLKSVIDHRAPWQDKSITFVFYDRQKQNSAYFTKWIRASQCGTLPIRISPVAHAKDIGLTLGCIEFADEQLKKDVLTWGTPNDTLLTGCTVIEMKFEKKLFYVAAPSMDFLKILKVGTIDEYHLVRDVGKQGAADVVPEDELPDLEANDSWDYEKTVDSDFYEKR